MFHEYKTRKENVTVAETTEGQGAVGVTTWLKVLTR